MDANTFLNGTKGPRGAFNKHTPVGTEIGGFVTKDPEVTQQTDVKDGTPKFWPDGNPVLQLVVEVQTNLREDAEDDGLRRFFISGKTAPGSQSQHDAVRSAVQAVGAPGVAKGGYLALQYIGEAPPAGPGLNGQKLWRAVYQAPPPGSENAQFLQQGAPQAPAQQAPQAPAQQAPPQGYPQQAPQAPAPQQQGYPQQAPAAPQGYPQAPAPQQAAPAPQAPPQGYAPPQGVPPQGYPQQAPQAQPQGYGAPAPQGYAGEPPF